MRTRVSLMMQLVIGARELQSDVMSIIVARNWCIYKLSCYWPRAAQPLSVILLELIEFSVRVMACGVIFQSTQPRSFSQRKMAAFWFHYCEDVESLGYQVFIRLPRLESHSAGPNNLIHFEL